MAVGELQRRALQGASRGLAQHDGWRGECTGECHSAGVLRHSVCECECSVPAESMWDSKCTISVAPLAVIRERPLAYLSEMHLW